MFLSHLHAWPDGESVREARPDAASGRLPWPLREALLQPAGQVPPPTPRGDPGANDVLELAVAEKRISSGHAVGRGREKWVGGPEDGPWYPFPHSKWLCIVSQVWGRETGF